MLDPVAQRVAAVHEEVQEAEATDAAQTFCSNSSCLQLLCVAAVGEEVQEADAADDGKRRSKKHKKHHKKEKRDRSSRREPEPTPAAPPQDRRYGPGMPRERLCNML